MTIIKYATVAVGRSSGTILICRGKETGRIGYTGEGPEVFSDPLWSEEVVDLPEPMTPTEYDEYIEDVFADENKDDPISRAYERVKERTDNAAKVD